MRSARKWAEEEFGDAELGDVRRTRRLVMLASEIAEKPAGTVTRSCASSASREGAFRFLENAAVRPDAVRASIQAATLARCSERKLVFVPIDTTSLNVTDRKKTKGLGRVGSWERGARGVQVITALAVGDRGLPLGIVGQEMSVVEERIPRRTTNKARYSAEGRRWMEMLHACRARFREQAPETTPWYQLDRGADCWQVLVYAEIADLVLTVRAAHDRCVDGSLDHLWSVVERAKIIATKRVELSARDAIRRTRHNSGVYSHYIDPAREARTARVAIRAVTVPLAIRTPEGECTLHLNAVLVREVRGRNPIEWLLLTTHPIKTKSDVLKVVQGYAYRWRIEDFHRAWKRGLCRVEDTQLRSRDAICKWATLLATVATRAIRLTHLARETPDVDASTELSTLELEALVALRQPKDVGARTTLAQAVRWLADLGGYAGPSSGPPGPTVVGRGLHDVLIAARAFANRKKR